MDVNGKTITLLQTYFFLVQGGGGVSLARFTGGKITAKKEGLKKTKSTKGKRKATFDNNNNCNNNNNNNINNNKNNNNNNNNNNNRKALFAGLKIKSTIWSLEFCPCYCATVLL